MMTLIFYKGREDTLAGLAENLETNGKKGNGPERGKKKRENLVRDMTRALLLGGSVMRLRLGLFSCLEELLLACWSFLGFYFSSRFLFSSRTHQHRTGPVVLD